MSAPDSSASPERSMPTVVYILAASHSGSTLLASLLGAHRETCTVGELKATSLGDPTAYRCSCGEHIQTCAFWRRVTQEMARRGVKFDIATAQTDVRVGATAYERRLLRPLHRGRLSEAIRDSLLGLSRSWRRRLPTVMDRNRKLVESLCTVCGVGVIIDSSKICLRLKYLLRDPKLDVRIVRLIRDGRAVASTYINPAELADAKDPQMRAGGTGRAELEGSGHSMRDAAHEWRRSNEEAEALLARVDRSRWTEVKYESLCVDTDRTLQALFEFIGLDAGRRVVDFRSRPTHILGNGMRFDRTSEVRLDERWREYLSEVNLREFDSVARDLNVRYGYQ